VIIEKINHFISSAFTITRSEKINQKNSCYYSEVGHIIELIPIWTTTFGIAPKDNRISIC
jgi:hypothetical protein